MSLLNANVLLVFVALIWGSAFVAQRFAQATDAAILGSMLSVQWLPLLPVLYLRAATGRAGRLTTHPTSLGAREIAPRVITKQIGITQSFFTLHCHLVGLQ